MQYFIAFLEGIITFISPCLLPMLPVYVSYFAGGGERSTRRTLTGAIGFVGGFTVVFVALGALAGALGGLLSRYGRIVDLVTGGIVILFGLGFLGVLRIPFFTGGGMAQTKPGGFFSAALFGIVFSIGWTPCVGTFLGSALMLASGQGSALVGIVMLLCYSLGLGIPFVVSAILIDRLKVAFDAIKRHYTAINRVCGVLLIVVGVLMMTGQMGRWLALLS